MVIVNYKGGQLANRIVSFAHFIAHSVEYQYALINPEFDEFQAYFQATSTQDFEGYPIKQALFQQPWLNNSARVGLRFWTDITGWCWNGVPFYRLFRIFRSHDKPGLPYELDQPAFTNAARRYPCVVQGWGFRSHLLVAKHADLLRRLFRPISVWEQRVFTLLEDVRRDTDVLLAVHIRRGDYRTFLGGKYFYELPVYIQKMQEALALPELEGKRVRFLICSNEVFQPNDFPAPLAVITARRHFMEDLYGMAGCDGIIGPPSTFSGWASFYGNVPIHVMQTADLPVQLAAPLTSV